MSPNTAPLTELQDTGINRVSFDPSPFRPCLGRLSRLLDACAELKANVCFAEESLTGADIEPTLNHERESEITVMDQIEYTTEVLWERNGQAFLDNRYHRRYTFQFDGGARVPGSASPHVVPLPLADESAVDPEELFVASLSSCHMLWFLSIAAKQRFCVDQYRDSASGWMENPPDGKPAMTRVTLRPEVAFSGDPLPTREQLDQMHHHAHEACFIANSVKTEVTCEPVYATL